MAIASWPISMDSVRTSFLTVGPRGPHYISSIHLASISEAWIPKAQFIVQSQSQIFSQACELGRSVHRLPRRQTAEQHRCGDCFFTMVGHNHFSIHPWPRRRIFKKPHWTCCEILQNVIWRTKRKPQWRNVKGRSKKPIQWTFVFTAAASWHLPCPSATLHKQILHHPADKPTDGHRRRMFNILINVHDGVLNSIWIDWESE